MRLKQTRIEENKGISYKQKLPKIKQNSRDYIYNNLDNIIQQLATESTPSVAQGIFEAKDETCFRL